MKHFHKILAGLYILFSASLSAQLVPPENCESWMELWEEQGPIHGYITVFEDPFDGSKLNTNFWGYGFPWGPVLDNDANEGLSSDNVEVNNGRLSIKTEKKPQWFYYNVFDGGEYLRTDSVWKNFTSGGIYSKYQFKLGAFEIRYRINELIGQWPAFWLLGQCSQEVDIFEYWWDQLPNSRNSIRYTTHLADNCDGKTCTLSRHYEKSPETMTDWHISKGVWQGSKLDFYFDNELEHSVYRLYDLSGQTVVNPQSGFYFRDASFPFTNYGMQVLIGQGVHHFNKNNYEINTYFEIDNVKIQKPINCNQKQIICRSYTSDLEYDGFVTGGEITVATEECNFQMNQGEYMHLFGSGSVELNPGFDTDLSKDFSAIAVACPVGGQSESKRDQILSSEKNSLDLIDHIEVYDLAGRKLYDYKNLNINKEVILDFVRQQINFSYSFYVIVGYHNNQIVFKDKYLL